MPDLWLDFTSENDNGEIIIVNAKRFGRMIIGLVCLQFQNTTLTMGGFNKMAAHATRHKRIWLYCKRNFPAAWSLVMAMSIAHRDRVIRHRWTFFVWGYAKDRVYVDKLLTLEHLKSTFAKCQNVPKSGRKLPQRNEICTNLWGGRLNDVIFNICCQGSAEKSIRRLQIINSANIVKI